MTSLSGTNGKLRAALVYMCQHYPHARELSKARLTKMIYLADWRSAILTGRQLSGITWRFNHYGPYVDDVVDLARQDRAFAVLNAENAFGSPMELVTLTDKDAQPDLSVQERAILQHVIDQTSGLYWNAFISLVYGTYPVKTKPRYSDLDLVALAEEYRRTPEGQAAVAAAGPRPAG